MGASVPDRAGHEPSRVSPSRPDGDHPSRGFTPGPWRADPDERSGWEWNWHIYAGRDNRICFMANTLPDLDLAEANARLIAAAPEMFGALADIMENPLYQTAIGGNPNMVERLMARANAALAKARGDQ